MANLSDDLRKILMAGVGAISMAAEKAPEALENLSKRGEETLQHGKVLNEQLQHEIKEAVKDSVTVVETKLDKDSVLTALDGMTPEELAEIKKKAAELSKAAKAHE